MPRCSALTLLFVGLDDRELGAIIRAVAPGIVVVEVALRALLRHGIPLLRFTPERERGDVLKPNPEVSEIGRSRVEGLVFGAVDEDLHAALRGQQKVELQPAVLDPSCRKGFDAIERDLDAAVASVAVEIGHPEELAEQRLGIRLASDVDTEEGMGRYKGLLMDDPIPGGVADRAGLRKGLRLLRINEVEIRGLMDVSLALEKVQRGDPVLLLVARIEEEDRYYTAQLVQLRVVSQ